VKLWKLLEQCDYLYTRHQATVKMAENENHNTYIVDAACVVKLSEYVTSP